MRKTKIICTIGPACADEETLTKMCLAGMNVARLNFSHGSHDEHKEKIELIKRVRENLDMPIPIMLDTKGPEYRIKTFASGSVEIPDGTSVTMTVAQFSLKRVRLNSSNFINALTEKLFWGEDVRNIK